MTLTPGTRLGPYEILARIGEGGMGVVYRARDPRLDRQVALKLLPADMAADPRARERLRREAMAVAALDHPYICKIFEIGEDGDALFLVMEYIAGKTLHQRLLEGRMPMPEALHVAGEIAEALQEAHAAGFLHRDLKPANIMLTQQGHVKVMDFGLAKRVQEMPSPDSATRDGGAQLTAHGAIVGTPDYMSPEQVKGATLDVRSDLFSFGVMVAEMAGGRHPFRKPSTMETFSAELREPAALGDDIPRGVIVVLQRLLAKDAEDRYASIADVRADLARLAAPSAEAGEQTVATGSRVAWSRPALGALAILVVGTVAYLLARSDALRPTSRAPETAVASGAIRSIAVLPLDNYSGSPNQDYFAEGMTEELTADLATISQLRVISRGSAMQFKGDHRPPTPEIARILNVDAVVEGSVSRAGDKVRITAQLIDARADKHLWARSFERSSRDVLALQDDLASAIASEIHLQLTPAAQSRLGTAPRVNPEAHDAYLKGRYFFNRPSDENLKKAIAFFDDAIRLSPDFAPAHSGLSDAYLWAGSEGILTPRFKPKAKAAAERAGTRHQFRRSACHSPFSNCSTSKLGGLRGNSGIRAQPNYAFAHDQFGLALAFPGLDGR
jgi:TolB-like protein